MGSSITTKKIEEGTVEAFQELLINNLMHTHGEAVQTANPSEIYMALCSTLRDYLMQRARSTVNSHARVNAKRVYYLSAEYLLGPQLEQNLLYTGTYELAKDALGAFGLDLNDYLAMDVEPGLGNGGLGRLAACYLDSMATLDIPSVGYGINYEFGIFRQTFEDGWQVEKPDEWLLMGNPWDYVKPHNMVEVGLGGGTEHYSDEVGKVRVRWHPRETVLGEPCTMLVPGYGTTTVNLLRLWRARASREFDFHTFDIGDYTRAVEQKVRSENISKVLYPNDETPQGKSLRLQQQYFFVACSLRDIFRRFSFVNDHHWDLLPEKVAIHLNDTHPVVAIPEWMRILVDEQGVEWERAWELSVRIFAYTCHTLMPEALETWSVDLFGELLPRHLEIIYDINDRFLAEVRERFPGDEARLARMSLIEEGPVRRVRMAHLACVGSHSVNGVAELHSRLLREDTLRDFAEMWPERFGNKTNGVSPRRFVKLSNPRLSALLGSRIGDGWIRDLSQISQLEKYADDAGFREEWAAVKQANKNDLAMVLRDRTGVSVNPESIYDVMVKRLHEYKRQLLKALHIITLYHRIKADPDLEMMPRTFVFGAKAAPGYAMAKLIIKLINDIAEVVNTDLDVRGRLQVAFPANFNISLAERIYPAADLSEQISLAGKEASGTGNMKFALNGAVTVGTLDGANIEIRERVGEENFFLFGLTAEEVVAEQRKGYQPRAYYEADEELRGAMDSIAFGQFSRGDRGRFRPLVDAVLGHDPYLVMADYRSYVDCSEAAARAYLDREGWTRMAILNAARCGFFSSDRAIREYCEGIWGAEGVKV